MSSSCWGTVVSEVLNQTKPWSGLYDPVVLIHIILYLDTSAGSWELPEMYYSNCLNISEHPAFFIDCKVLLLWFLPKAEGRKMLSSSSAPWCHDQWWIQVALDRVLVLYSGSLYVQESRVLQSWSFTPSALDECVSRIRHWMKNKVLLGKKQKPKTRKTSRSFSWGTESLGLK